MPTDMPIRNVTSDTLSTASVAPVVQRPDDSESDVKTYPLAQLEQLEVPAAEHSRHASWQAQQETVKAAAVSTREPLVL